MPCDDQDDPPLLVLDTNSISTIFRFYHRTRFPSFWEAFDALVQLGRANSVRIVRHELDASPQQVVRESVAYLEALSQDFFADPTEPEQGYVREMTNDTAFSEATNRWTSKGVDADPYLIAKVRATPHAILVTEESQDIGRRERIPSICHRLGLCCINFEQAMERLGWQF